ncbi:MAG: hypothetical protein ACPHCL_05680, partial [Candidatus Puniceispirillaceae bacterium]
MANSPPSMAKAAAKEGEAAAARVQAEEEVGRADAAVTNARECVVVGAAGGVECLLDALER